MLLTFGWRRLRATATISVLVWKTVGTTA